VCVRVGLPMSMTPIVSVRAIRVACANSSAVRKAPFAASSYLRTPHGSRRVHLAGCTTNPSGAWVVQQARNLSFTNLFERMRFLIHDRDSKFTAAFDELFSSERIKVIHTPVQAPQANAYAERFVRTVRNECLDWLLILGRRHLEHVLRIYVQHYNRERPHRGLALTQPEPPEIKPSPGGDVHRRDRLGGLVHEYYRAAA
jgi:putative transposase